MATNYTPAPGVQMPQNYNVPVGPNYRKYGEQPGYIYFPQTDQYYIDPKSVEEQYKKQGLIKEPPKEPGLSETLLPIGAAAGTLALASEGGKQLPGLLGGLFESGGGEVAKTAAQEAVSGGIATPNILGASRVGEAAASAGSSGGAFSLGGIGSAGNAILPAAGLIGIGDVFLNKRTGARGIGQGAASGAAMGSYFGLPGAAIGAGIGGLLGFGNSVFNKPSTRDIQRKHTKGLLGTAPDDAQWQGYVQAMRAQNESAPPDPSKPFAGKYATWDDYVRGGLEAGDLTGVYGNLQTFGPDWANLSQDQRQKVTQGIIDAGLYNSKKGEVEISDPVRAKQIYDQIIRGAQPVAMPRGGLIGNAVANRIPY